MFNILGIILILGLVVGGGYYSIQKITAPVEQTQEVTAELDDMTDELESTSRGTPDLIAEAGRTLPGKWRSSEAPESVIEFLDQPTECDFGSPEPMLCTFIGWRDNQMIAGGPADILSAEELRDNKGPRPRPEYSGLIFWGSVWYREGTEEDTLIHFGLNMLELEITGPNEIMLGGRPFSRIVTN